MSGSSCIWELGEAIVEEILKGRRLGARGFAWIRVSLLFGRSFEVLSHSLAVNHIDSSFWGLWELILVCFGVWRLDLRLLPQIWNGEGLECLKVPVFECVEKLSCPKP